MPLTATSVAAATTMLAAVAAIFLIFVLCFYLFLCAKRYRGAAPTLSGASSRARFVFAGGESGAAWCHDRGIDEEAIAALPRKEVGKGEVSALDCAVCITELAAGEEARVLPRCGHGFHVECVDMWLRSHSTCPICRCPVIDEPPEVAPAAVQPPEADPESPNFPTNVLFFGSHDEVSTGGAPPPPPPPVPPVPATPVAGTSNGGSALPAKPGVAAVVEAARIGTLRRLLIGGGGRRGGAPPPPQADGDIEMGLGGGAAATESSVSLPAKSQTDS